MGCGTGLRNPLATGADPRERPAGGQSGTFAEIAGCLDPAVHARFGLPAEIVKWFRPAR